MNLGAMRELIKGKLHAHTVEMIVLPDVLTFSSFFSHFPSFLFIIFSHIIDCILELA